MNLLKLMNQDWAIKYDSYVSIMEILKSHKEGPKVDLKALEAKMLALNPQTSASGNEPYMVYDGIAIIPVKGVLSKSPSLFERVIYGATSMSEIKNKISHAENNAKISGILLDVDSPGGTVDGTQELADYIYKVRDSKPVFAYCDGLMASAGYWIGSAASEIYISSKTVQIGSIGVITVHYDFSKMDEQFGVTVTEIFAGKYKAAGSDVKPLSPEDKEYIQSRIDYLYSVFVEAVAQNRNESVETVLGQMADAKIFIGQEAINAGLVDGVSTFDGVIEKMKSGNTAGAAVSIKGTIIGDGSGVILPPASQSLKTASGADAVSKLNNNQENKVDLTIEILKKDHPELFAAIKKEITDENAQGEQIIRESAAAAERERIKGVADQLMPGHEKIINEMMFDGKTTPGEAAIRINSENKKALESAGKDFMADSSGAVDHANSAEGETGAAGDSNKPTEESAKEAWDKDAKLRAEFGDNFASYLSYVKANNKGAVKIQAKKEVVR